MSPAFPPAPNPPTLAKIPVKGRDKGKDNAVPSIKSESAVTVTLPPLPSNVSVKMDPKLVIFIASFIAISIVLPRLKPVIREIIWLPSKQKFPLRSTTGPPLRPLVSTSAKLVRSIVPRAVNCVTSTALLILVASSCTSPGDFTLTTFTRDPGPVIVLRFIAISPATTENDFWGATFKPPGPGIIFSKKSRVVLLPVIETDAGVVERNPNALTGAEVSTSVPPRFALNLPPPTRFR